MTTKPAHTCQRCVQILCFLVITGGFSAYKTWAHTIEFLDCFHAAAFEMNQHLPRDSTGFLDVQGVENGGLKLLATDQIQLGSTLAVYYSQSDNLMDCIETTNHLEPGFYDYKHLPPPKGNHQSPSNNKHSAHGILLRKNGQKVLFRFTNSPMIPELCRFDSGVSNQQPPRDTGGDQWLHSVSGKPGHKPAPQQQSHRGSPSGAANQVGQGAGASGGSGEPPEPPDNHGNEPDDYNSDEEQEALKHGRLNLVIRTLIFSIRMILKKDTTADNQSRECLNRKCDVIDHLIRSLNTYDINSMIQHEQHQQLITLLRRYLNQYDTIRHPKTSV